MGSLQDEPTVHGSSKPHILMVPLAGFGHHYQFLQLLRLLADYEGVTVTFVSSKERVSELANLQANGEFSGIDLRLEPLHGPTKLYPQDPHFPYRAAVVSEQFKEEFEPFAKQMIELKKNGLPGVPTCVISDMLVSFPEELASQLGVPWYSLYVSSPPFANLCLHIMKMHKERLHPYESPRRNETLDIPGLTFARVRDQPLENLDSEFSEYWQYQSKKMARAAGFICNSAEELDAPAGALEAIRFETGLQAKAAHREVPKVFAIGPILNFPGFTGSPKCCFTGANSSPCLEFLNNQPTSSVLYISFGSAANISPESMTELAHGLEASRVPFLWAVKFVNSLAGACFPPGFEERTKGRGYIEMGWAPQAQILSHPSTGGFLSHCGWNSTLESLCAGVPVITWPLAVDQPLNARFIENVSKSGVSVKPYSPGDEKLLLPSRGDIRKTVQLLMIEKEGEQFRKNAEKWKTVLKACVAKGGSSYKALHQLLDDILLRNKDNGKK